MRSLANRLALSVVLVVLSAAGLVIVSATAQASTFAYHGSFGYSRTFDQTVPANDPDCATQASERLQWNEQWTATYPQSTATGAIAVPLNGSLKYTDDLVCGAADYKSIASYSGHATVTANLASDGLGHVNLTITHPASILLLIPGTIIQSDPTGSSTFASHWSPDVTATFASVAGQLGNSTAQTVTPYTGQATPYSPTVVASHQNVPVRAFSSDCDTAFNVKWKSVKTATFAARSSNDPSLGCRYSWAFGDGSTAANAAVVTHTYAQPIPYNVQLSGQHGTVINTSAAIAVASPVYRFAPIVSLDTTEKYFPEDANKFISESALYADLPDPHAPASLGIGSCADKLLVGKGAVSELGLSGAGGHAVYTTNNYTERPDNPSRTRGSLHVYEI